MLATLNLQLPPMEITDDSSLTPAMTPDDAPIAGFADLLRLRVDTAADPGTPSGELLPQGGSELPLQALPVEFDAPPAPGLSVLPQAEPALTPPLVELAPEQPLAASLAVKTEIPVPATVAPAIKGLDPAMTVADSRDGLLSTETRPLPVMQQSLPRPVTPGQIQETLTSLSAKLETEAPALREAPLPVQMQPAAAQTAKSMPVVELPRRVEVSPLPAVNVEEISDVFKARPTVTQPVQVLNAQPNPQQPVVMTAPPAAVTMETGYAAAVQQANDLISVPVRDRGWGEQIGERVLMMAGNQMKSAEIRLTPAELGPLRVQVSVDDGAANVTFQAQHAVTREAIEQALPRLRELLAENGLSLGQASVGEQGVAEGNRDERSSSLEAGSGDSFDGNDGSESTEPQRVVASNSLVDTFV